MFALFLADLMRRGRIANARFHLGLRWLRGQMRDVIGAIILDLACVFIGITWTVLSESNKPARYTFIPVMLIGMYIAGKLAAPVWFGELGLVAYRKTTDLLPDWARKLVRRTEATSPSPLEKKDAVWYDKSIGGQIFHVLGTVWMWLHVVLYASGFLPVWRSDWMSFIVMATCFILFFVWTEEFAKMRKWRRRLAYAIGCHIAVMLVIMVVATVAPGTYNDIAARFGYHEGVKQVDANALNAQAAADRAYLAGLRVQDGDYKAAYRAHTRDANGRLNQYDADWTADNATDWAAVTKQIAIETSSPSKAATDDISFFNDEGAMFRALVLLVLFIAVVGATFSFVKSFGHKQTTASH